MWGKYHQWWLDEGSPVHIIRYEDLLSDPERVLKHCMEFVLSQKDISGTKIEQYIKLATKDGAPMIYSPRSGKTGKNLALYSPDQLEIL